MSEKMKIILANFIHNLNKVSPDEDLRSYDTAMALLINGGEIVWKATNIGKEMYPIRRYKSDQDKTKILCANVPYYTTELSSAFCLVGTKSFLMTNLSENTENKTWYVSLGKGKAFSNSPAIAICLAYLRHLEAIFNGEDEV